MEEYTLEEIEIAQRLLANLANPALESIYATPEAQEKIAKARRMEAEGVFGGPLATSNLVEAVTPNPDIGDATIAVADAAGELVPDMIAEPARSMADAVSPWIPKTVKDVLGVGEAALSMGSGLVSMVPAGGGFTLQMLTALGDKTWYDALKDGVETAENVMGWMTYTPKTEIGKDATAAVTAPFLAFDAATTAAGNTLRDLMGGTLKNEWNDEQKALAQDFQLVTSQIFEFKDNDEPVPQYLTQSANAMRQQMSDAGMFDANVDVNDPAIFAGVGLKTVLDFSPDALISGSRYIRKRDKVNEFRAAMREAGIDLTGTPEAQIQQWANLIDNTPNSGKYSSFLDAEGNNVFRQQLIDAQKEAFDMSQALYQAAKDADGYIPVLNLQFLDETLGKIAEAGKWEKNTPKLGGWLQQFRGIVEGTADMPPNQQGRKINDIWEYRQEINEEIAANVGRNKKRRYVNGLFEIKNSLDSFLDNQFEADLIAEGDNMLFLRHTDPDNAIAVQKWRDADKWYKNYSDNFTSQKVVQKILKEDLTAKSVRNLILGANAAELKPQAAQIVRTMKNIFPDVDGVASAQMQAIQAEVKFSLMEPLLQVGGPDLAGFTNRFNRFKTGNTELIQELFTEEQFKNLELLSRAANANLDVLTRTGSLRSGGTGRRENITQDSLRSNDMVARLVAVNLAGSGAELARGGAKIAIIKRLWGGLTDLAAAPYGEIPGLGGTESTMGRRVMSAMYEEELGLGPNALDRPLRGITSMPRELPIVSIEQSRLAEERAGANTPERLGRMQQRLRDESARRTGAIQNQ